MERRAFLSGTTAILLGACAPPIVRRAEPRPIAPDPRGGVLVVIEGGRARYGPVFVGTTAILGACVMLTHFVTLLPPGRQLVVAYDDDSYDAAEAEIVPGAIYAIEVEHTEGELEIHPLVPGRDPIRRLLDETERVELARAPRRADIEAHERKVRLGHLRYNEYSASKRASRAIGPAHVWR